MSRVMREHAGDAGDAGDAGGKSQLDRKKSGEDVGHKKLRAQLTKPGNDVPGMGREIEFQFRTKGRHGFEKGLHPDKNKGGDGQKDPDTDGQSLSDRLSNWIVDKTLHNTRQAAP